VRHKGETIAKVMNSSPLSVTFRRDLVGPQLATKNALLHHLTFVQYRKGQMIDFCWNLNENGKLSVDSMYRAFFQLLQSVLNNNNFWKMKILLKTKTKVLALYLCRGVIFTKDNL
jgi:hypothetical protein